MYSNSLPGYDAWLEAPYVDAARYADECERVAELLGLTEEEAETYDYDEYFAEQYDEPDFDDYDEDAAIEAAENAYEDSMGW